MKHLNLLIDMAISEDLPAGDLTTDSLQAVSKIGYAHIIAKQDLVLSGTVAVQQVLAQLAPGSEIKWQFQDSDIVLSQQRLCSIKGNLFEILKAERIALNFLGHLSGIATLTRAFVNKVSHTKTKILDTRKTTPGYRSLEKAAVAHGGGQNHRMSLSDAVLIKENHIRVAQGIPAAVTAIRKAVKTPIEVEVTNLQEVAQALELKVDRLLLDNMDNQLIEQALKLVPSHVTTEASGNMSLSRVQSVAELGVDFISVGALTHSAPVQM